MLEGLLERVLLRFLAPYVDGISRDKLHLGVLSGSLELRDLTVKRETPALLGADYIRAASGGFALIKITVPWKSLFSGKVAVQVKGVTLNLEHVAGGRPDDEVVEEMRHGKRRTIELRAQQLRELVEKEDTEEDAKTQEGSGAKLVRKVLNNLQLDFSDLSAGYSSESFGFACGAKLPSLSVLSADDQFRTGAARAGGDNQEGNADGSLYKVLTLQQLDLRMAPAGCHSLTGAEHVITPITIALNLAHVPSKKKLELSLQTADGNGLRLCRSQSKHLMGLSAALAEEKQRLEALLAPPEVQEQLFASDNGQAALDEYAQMYRRHALEERALLGEMSPLNDEEKKRLSLLEDLMPVIFLARQRCKVLMMVDHMAAEVDKRKAEAEAQARKQQGMFSRMFGRKPKTPTAEAPLITQEEREEFWKEVDDESKVEEVELPNTIDLRFKLGSTKVDLIDDRFDDSAQRQLLYVDLKGADTTLNFEFGEDHRGNSTAAFAFNARLLQFEAQQHQQTLVRSRGHIARDALPTELPIHVAHLLVQNRLEESRSVLKLGLDFVPMELRALPGVLEPIMDFFKKPQQPIIAKPVVAAPETRPPALRYEELVDLSKQVLAAHSGTAKDTVVKVYERLPDAMELEIRVASPVLQVPIAGVGQATVSLGQLLVATPQPCAYSAIALDVHLTDAGVNCASEIGEKFEVLQPVPIDVYLRTAVSPDENKIDLQIRVEQLFGQIAPQACRILLQMPTALSAVMGSSPDASSQPSPSIGATAQSTPASSAEEPHESQLRRFSSAVQEVAKTDDEASQVLAQAAAKVEEVRNTKFSFALKFSFDKFQVVLADSITPVLRLYMQAPDPGFQLSLQRVPNQAMETSARIDNVAVEVEFMNPRHGYYEPLLETFSLDVDVKLGLDKKEKVPLTHVTVGGRRPLLATLSPTAVKTTAWFIPVFLASLSSTSAVADGDSNDASVAPSLDDAVAASHGTKYKLVNLCDETFELEFKSSHKSRLGTEVAPTGSAWISLDEWILPYFAESVTVKVKGSQSASMPLSLVQGIRSVSVPGVGDVFAELLAPHPSCRLILLAPSLRLHNQTDMPLIVRFHEPTKMNAQYGGLTTTCDAELLGLTPASVLTVNGRAAKRSSITAAQETPGGLLLAPNRFCAVPASARVGTKKLELLQTHISLQATGVEGAVREFCKEAYVGHGAPSCTLQLPGNIHIVVEAESRAAPPPAIAKIATVVLRPTLTLENALSVGNMSVSLAAHVGGNVQQRDSWKDVRVPCLERVNVYSCPSVLRQGILLRARLEDNVPWSKAVAFSRGALTMEAPDAELSESLDLRQTTDGAAAGVFAVPKGKFELRLECTNWFVDRCGLPHPFTFELWHNRARLPAYNGITLLPHSCFEEDCELRLMKQSSTQARRNLRMPIGWTTFAWSAPCGSLNLCVQQETVCTQDLLGARCQVFTLRPRVVLTNASTKAIEIMQQTSSKAQPQVIALSVGESKVMHYDAQDDDQSTNVSFRSVDGEQSQWSPVIRCNEASAGSYALVLPPASAAASAAAAAGSLIPDAWTVDVAPSNGAVAMTFKDSSWYTVKNRTKNVEGRGKVVVSLRPEGSPELRINPGNAVCYGWQKPDSKRSVLVTLEAAEAGSKAGRSVSMKIADVHVKARHAVPILGVVVVTSSRGGKQFLEVQELGGGSATQDDEDQNKSMLRVEAKLGRIGLSLVQDKPNPRELLYLQLELIRFGMLSHARGQDLQLLISEAQVDCQLPGRIDGSTAGQRQKAQETDALGLMKKDKSAVLLANCAEGDKAFLELAVQLGRSSGRDLVLHMAELGLDELDFNVDDDWLERVHTFIRGFSDAEVGGGGVPLRAVRDTANKPIVYRYKQPPLPMIVQVDQLRLSSLDVTMWAVVKLKTINFLSPQMLTAVRILSASSQLTLDGAKLSLPERVLPNYRGSLKDFISGLVSEYQMNLVAAAATLLGKSSLLNVPRAPLKLGSAGVSFVTETVGIAAGSATKALTMLTMDSEYAARQKEVRANKQISSAGQGFSEAGKSIATGFTSGMKDIFTKPGEGFKKQGIGGFITGLGQGVTGAVFKPISGVGQAISDVGAGVSAQVSQTAGLRTQEGMRVQGRIRSRLPRLLYSIESVVRPWSSLDGEVLRQLGKRATHGVQAVIPLTREAGGQTTLLLFVDRLLLVQVSTAHPGSSGSKAQRKTSGDASSSGKDLANQVFMPFNVIATGVNRLRDIGETASESVEEPGDPAVLEKMKQLLFRDLVDVKLDATAGDNIDRVIEKINLQATHGMFPPLSFGGVERCGRRVREQLAEGFGQALSSKTSEGGGIVDWTGLLQALKAEEREALAAEAASGSIAARTSRSASQEKSGGQLRLEVFELERQIIGTGDWRTPFMPTDWEASWRWVDAAGYRHPHLAKGKSREACSVAARPPCAPYGLLKPVSDWKVEANAKTDKEGWQYAIAFNSSTWETAPGIFDAVRKRKWTRTYE